MSSYAMERLLATAIRIPLTDDENELFAVDPSRVIAQISERIGIPLSSGRVAHAPAMKLLLVVD